MTMKLTHLKDPKLCMQIYAAVAVADFATPVNDVQLFCIDDTATIEIHLSSRMNQYLKIKDRYLSITISRRELYDARAGVIDFLAFRMREAKHEFDKEVTGDETS